MKNDILTRTGIYFDFVNPTPEMVNLYDVAWALSNTCRFSGHTRCFYSVAEHSVYVSQLVPPKFALQALLHDAAEAYVGDVPSPLKIMLPDYKEVEKRVEKVVFQHFGLPEKLDPCVKLADMVMLKTEQKQLMENQDEWASCKNVEESDIVIKGMTQSEAMLFFMYRYSVLSSIDNS